MKTILAALAIIMSTTAFAKDLSCVNNGKKILVSINEKSHSISISTEAQVISFKIYDTKNYQVESGNVVSYSVKDGRDSNGSSLSGEIATLNNNTVAMNILNDSLGKTVISIDGMKCK